MGLREVLGRLPEPVVGGLREAKHRVAVTAKHASWGFPQVRGPLLEPAWRAWQGRRPHPFPPDAYAGTWLGRSLPARPVEAGESVPRRIFTAWTGGGELPPRRADGLASLRAVNPGVEVVLVTPDNLGDWLVPGEPLPAAYPNLSFVHRSDVLRAYLLHHHGGGWSDLKPARASWEGAFARLEGSDGWLLGYTERHRLLVPLVGGRLEKELRQVSGQLLGYGGLVARPGTPLTGEWLARVAEVLEAKSGLLSAHPGDAYGVNPGYPLAWTEVLAHVLAPLTWKYAEHVLHDDRVRPELKAYR